MSYHIENHKDLQRIGAICISKKNNDWREIVQMDDWDRKAGATIRIAWGDTHRQTIVDKDGNTNHNPSFHTTLLRLKEGTKATFFSMNENEEWDETNPWYVSEVFIDQERVEYLNRINQK